ncbi:MAG: ABC transporter ATP-binding protein [Tissierellia bacterium]|nr:ABC transporter ATP-binding protein [Tissierellia bacterium]
MKRFLKEKFQLTDTGAEGLRKSILASFWYYVSLMLPMIIFLSFVKLVIDNKIVSPYIYGIVIIIATIIIYFVINREYKTSYNETYKESANLRIEIADILKSLPISYFSKHDVSDLAQTIMADVSAIEHALSHAVNHAFGLIFFFCLISTMLLIGNFKLALCVILPILLSLLLLFISKRNQISMRKKHYKILRDITEYFQSSIENNNEIKSYDLKEETLKKLLKDLEDSEKLQVESELSQSIPVSVAGWITNLSIAFTIYFGVNFFMSGELEFINLIGYTLAAVMISNSFVTLYLYIAEIFYLDARINRIKELRSTKIQTGEIQEFDNYDITFENVRFSYDKNETEVIKGISFVAKQNEITALIGPSGCGKSTILRLISRLFDYDSGKIYIGDKDIKTVETECLFEKISIVFQDVVLFNTSVMENIRIGNINASDEEVMNAAKIAGCEEFIDNLPEKYNTFIGENGAKLSGGERQRLSIARALLKDAPIILLDEIAASLDVENEFKLQQGLNRLIKDKTVIIISHRMKSIENVDKIVLLNAGLIDSIGRHDELLEKSELYRNLIEKSKKTEEFKY